MSAKITKISVVGVVEIEFNSSMLTEGLDLKHINSTVLDIYVAPALNRHLKDNFDIKKLNLTWEAVSFMDKILMIQVNFDNSV